MNTYHLIFISAIGTSLTFVAACVPDGPMAATSSSSSTGGMGTGGQGGGGAPPVACASDADCAPLVPGPCHVAACDLTGTVTDPGSPVVGCSVRATMGEPCSEAGAAGKCAANMAEEAVCCTGCVDFSGHCRKGNFAGACGLFGVACEQCAAGMSCSSVGACATNCANPGAACPGGILGNGTDGQCVCCKGCFNADGLCVDGTAQDMCGVAGMFCQNCGGQACSQGQCK